MSCDRAALIGPILDRFPTEWDAVLLADGLVPTLTPSLRALIGELADALRAGELGQMVYLRALVLTDDDDLTALAAAARSVA